MSNLKISQLRQLIGKASFAAEADRHSAYMLLDELSISDAAKAGPSYSHAEPTKTPQAEGADWFIVIDPGPDGDGAVFAYDANLGREFGHDHIKDAQDREDTRAARWVVRPAYADRAAHAAAPAVPQGWVLVPVEPDVQMRTAGAKASDLCAYSPVGVYAAMLSAAPQPPKEQG